MPKATIVFVDIKWSNKFFKSAEGLIACLGLRETIVHGEYNDLYNIKKAGVTYFFGNSDQIIKHPIYDSPRFQIKITEFNANIFKGLLGRLIANNWEVEINYADA